MTGISVCRNNRCLEDFERDGWQFCPSCRLAIAIGFKYGAVIVGSVAALCGFLLGWR